MASGNNEISEPAKKKLKISSLKTQPINPHLLRTPSGPASLRQLSQGSQFEIDSDEEELNGYQKLLEEGKGVSIITDDDGITYKKINELNPKQIDSSSDIANLDISKGFVINDKLLVDVTTQKKDDSYNDLIVYIKNEYTEVVDYYRNTSNNFNLEHSGDFEEEINFGEVGSFNCLKHCCLFKFEEYKQVKAYFLNEVIANTNPPKIISKHNEGEEMRKAFKNNYDKLIEKLGYKPNFVIFFAQVTYIADKTLVSMSPDISPCVSTIFNGNVYTAPWSDSTNMTIHFCVISKN